MRFGSVVIRIFPMSIAGVTDLERNEILVSPFQNLFTMFDTLLHEFAHIVTGDDRHSSRWLELYRSLGGCLPHNSNFDREFRNIGNIPNIGNISGIQTMYALRLPLAPSL